MHCPCLIHHIILWRIHVEYEFMIVVYFFVWQFEVKNILEFFFEETLFECVIYYYRSLDIKFWSLNQTLMGHKGCIPFISSDHAKSPFLSLFYNLQIFYLHAYPIYLPAAASFPRVNKFAIVQAIQVIASLCSSDALLTSDPKEPCPRHLDN